MTVSILARIEDACGETTSERVRILVPGDQGCFHATPLQSEGGRRSVVRAPQVCIVDANRPTDFACQRSADMVVIAIDADFQRERSHEAFGEPRELQQCCVRTDPFLRGLANVLSSAWRAGTAPSRAYLDSIAAAVALHLATHYDRASAPPVASGLAPHKLQRVIAVIEERLAEAIQVKELADTIHMSPFHFARMFKQATGHPPHAYITVQRMEHAKNLLGNSELSLLEVASSVGYQTQAHFTGVFHRHVGVTPRSFRLSSRGERRAAAAD
jgi:AraC-like DNA-binding protein